MRHWFFYDADGEIKGQSTSYRGYAPGGDPNDPNTPCPQCLGDRQHNLVNPGNTGAVSYDCPNPTQLVGIPSPDPCDPDCFVRAQTYYVEADSLVLKPTIEMVIDGAAGVEVEPLVAHTVQKTPGETVTFKFTGPAPDGHEITLQRGGNALVAPSDLVLTFTGGETNEVNLTAPSQGIEGGVFWSSKYVTGSAFIILGWA